MYVVDGTAYLDDFDAKNIPNGQYLTLEEYGETYGIKPSTLRSWIKRGQICTIKMSQNRYILAGEMPKKRGLQLRCCKK